MADSLLYRMDRKKVGHAVIINNLDEEQIPTKKDVDAMGQVLKDIGFDVQIHKNLTSQQMNSVKRDFTDIKLHSDSNCFLVLVISHGTSDNFLQDRDANRTWNIESLITEVSDISTLVGRPKLFFIEACRGKEHNFSQPIMSKASATQPSSGITLPSKQDIFVGFATVPGFVSFTSSIGSPYLQTLAKQLSEHHKELDLADIHLLVKRELANCKLGYSGARQGAEERSSLLSKLKFSQYKGSHKGSLTGGSRLWSLPPTLVNNSPVKPIQPSRPLQTIRPTTPSRTITTTSSNSKPLTFSGSIPSILHNGTPSTTPTTARPPYRSPYSDQRLPTNRVNPTASTSTSTSYSSPNLRQLPTTTAFTGVLKPTQLPASLTPSSTISSRTRSHSSHEPVTSVATSSLLSSTYLTRPRSATDIPSAINRPNQPNRSKVTKHVVNIDSKDIEKGLGELLEKVIELYGGKGKLKVTNHYIRKPKKTYSFEYKNGNNDGKSLLDNVAVKVNNMEEKGAMWTFTQTITHTTMEK